MKLAIVLTHPEIVSALTAVILDKYPESEVTHFDFAVNGDGEVSAVGHTNDVGSDSDAKAEPAKATRSRRGSASKDEAPAETEDKPVTRSRRGVPKDEAEEAVAEEKPASTRSRRGATKPAEPTVPEKTEDEYDVNPDEDTAEEVTYWTNNDDESEVFAVPAEQALPDYDLYTEVETLEEALALLTPAVKEAEPAKATRTRRTATKEADVEEAPATTTRSRRGAAPVAEAEEEAKPATRTRRGSAATAPAEEAPATTGRRKIFNRG